MTKLQHKIKHWIKQTWKHKTGKIVLLGLMCFFITLMTASLGNETPDYERNIFNYISAFSVMGMFIFIGMLLGDLLERL